MDRKIYEKSPVPCSCLNLRRASMAITQVYDEILEPSGLKIGQFFLLRNIKQFGPISVSQLAIEARLDRTTLVRNLKGLEEKGFVEDIASNGARTRQLKLTELGLEKLEEAKPLWSKAQTFVETYLGKEDVEKLTTLLSKIEALVP